MFRQIFVNPHTPPLDGEQLDWFYQVQETTPHGHNPLSTDSTDDIGSHDAAVFSASLQRATRQSEMRSCYLLHHIDHYDAYRPTINVKSRFLQRTGAGR